MLLDTHVLIWAVEGDPRLGRKAHRMIDEAGKAGNLGISAITPWEIAMLTQKGRLALGRDVGAWIDEALALPGLHLHPLDPAISVDSVRLPGELHADPADRIIVATARAIKQPLMTADRALLGYGAMGHVHAVDASL